jgi:thioredoxin 1
LATLSELTSAERVDAALAAPGLLVLDVYTQSCVICRRIEPMVAAVAIASGGAVRAHKLDAERHAEFGAKYDIRGVPTLLLFRDGRLVLPPVGFFDGKRSAGLDQREGARMTHGTIGLCLHISSLTHPRLRSRLARFLMRPWLSHGFMYRGWGDSIQRPGK